MKCGNVTVCTLENFASTAKGQATLERLLRNAGVPVAGKTASGKDGVDDTSLDGLLTKPVN